MRRRRRITDSEVGDLAGLVLRRPDAEEVFFQVGELLAGKDAPARSSRGIFPEKLRFRLARRQVMRRFQALFGQTLGGFAHGPFALEARGHLLLEMDPGGDACALMTGFAQVILGRYLPSGYAVVHTHCQGRKDEICRWVAREGKG